MASQQGPVPEEGETKRKWQDVAQELSEEQDPVKRTALYKELNNAMLEEERLKARRRIGPSQPRRRVRHLGAHIK